MCDYSYNLTDGPWRRPWFPSASPVPTEATSSFWPLRCVAAPCPSTDAVSSTPRSAMPCTMASWSARVALALGRALHGGHAQLISGKLFLRALASPSTGIVTHLLNDACRPPCWFVVWTCKREELSPDAGCRFPPVWGLLQTDCHAGRVPVPTFARTRVVDDR